jgi:hypothetical protein
MTVTAESGKFLGTARGDFVFFSALLPPSPPNQDPTSQRRKKTNPKTSDGQVHPTASSGPSCQPNINANRPRIHPKVLLQYHFETAHPQFPIWNFPAGTSVGPQISI